MNEATVDQRRTTRATIRLWILIACGLLVVLAANAHLLYVAAKSQPACVAHLRRDDTAATAGFYRAAQSVCSLPIVRPSGEGQEQ